jgi:hypothetical protein
MSFSRKLLAGFAFVIVSLTVSIWAINTKGELLGPKISQCPSAFNGLMTLMYDLSFSESLTQDVWDCGIGGMLYFAIPGLGIGWIVAKNISD